MPLPVGSAMKTRAGQRGPQSAGMWCCRRQGASQSADGDSV